MCKNFELYGKCKYGDEVSWNFKFYSIFFKMCILQILIYIFALLFSVHLLIQGITWWSKLRYQSSTRPNSVKSIAQMGIVLMEWDASLFTILRRLSNRISNSNKIKITTNFQSELKFSNQITIHQIRKMPIVATLNRMTRWKRVQKRSMLCLPGLVVWVTSRPLMRWLKPR